MTTDVVPILRVSDAAVAVAWYARLGFEQTFEHRFEPDLPAYVGIRREGAQIHLSEHAGDARPFGLVYLWVDDVDATASEFAVAVDAQPWGREVQLADPDGNRLRISEPPGGRSADEVLGNGVTATLVDLERAMWNETTRADRAWMDSHLSAAFTEIGLSGRYYSRSEVLEMAIGEIDVVLTAFAVRPLGRDAAIVTYRSSQPRGVAHRSSVWLRQAGTWLLDVHQATPAAAK